VPTQARAVLTPGPYGVGAGDVAGEVGLAGGVVPGADVGAWLGDGLAGPEGLAVRDGLGDRDGVGVADGVTGGTEVAGACVGLTAGWTAGAGTGRTRMYRASTPRNRPVSTSVEVRGRPVMEDSR
jgi:hypothetical protein